MHGVFSRWEAIVGREVGQHVTPESFADGRLVVRTDSTAWATQMKLLAPDVVRRLNEVLGDETVQVIDVDGPRGPVVEAGSAAGQGPRSARHLRLSDPQTGQEAMSTGASGKWSTTSNPAESLP